MTSTAVDPVLELLFEAKERSIDGFAVVRALPSLARRSVGPFVFFDHLGPSRLAPGQGLDVRPHPHIHLSTVTYLFEGEILHRDSLGTEQRIRPGAINWMTAGRGIVHSERTPHELRADGPRLHALQLWVALPKSSEDVQPSFAHHPADTLPEVSIDQVRLRVLAGSAFGEISPVAVHSPLFYVEATLAAGATLEIPPEHDERAVYLVNGSATCGQTSLTPRTLAVLRPKTTASLTTTAATRLVLFGGATLDGPRYIWWNFVSSSKERIVAAARDWRAGAFPRVPGDDIEFIPLDDEPHFT